MRACLAVAEESSADVVVHLDHATREDLVHQAIDLGVGSVMFDASALAHDDNGARTRPDEAAACVAATGVDALAVAVDIPLVLHGSSGVPDAGLQSAVSHGMTKINIATHLNKVMTAAVRTALADEALVDPRKYLGPGRDAIAAEVARLLVLLAP